jgi:phosphatidylserine/phosphatidylglycerophosphate/cardiolipin synthase-like enzyme
LCALAAAACTSTSLDRAAVHAVVAARRDTSIRADDRPASSLLQEGAMEALARSTADERRHRVALLNVGDEALLARIHAIRAARETIDLQTFIWSDDQVARFVLFDLLRAARRGVRVRLLVDQMGVGVTSETLARMTSEHANLEVRIFNPVGMRAGSAVSLENVLLRFEALNHRMHNKVMAVDRRIGIVGGRNIADEYYDRDLTYNFIDREVLVLGPAVGDMADSFEEYWSSRFAVPAEHLVDVGRAILCTADDRRIAWERPRVPDSLAALDRAADGRDLTRSLRSSPLHAVGEVEFVADAPDKGRAGDGPSALERTRAELVAAAEHTVLVQTPYLVLSPELVEAVGAMRARNPHIDVATSTNGLAAADHAHVYGLSHKHRMRMVRDLGLRIHELKPVPGSARRFVARYDELRADARREGGRDPQLGVHAKSVCIDARIAFVGSHNFDPRSYRMNTEVGVVIYDRAVAESLEGEIRAAMSPGNSWLVAPKEHVPFVSSLSGLVASASRALPLFDLWPLRYTTCYELREGMTAVSPGHPDFHEHWRDVGSFPGVDLSSDLVITHAFSAFGALTSSLM